jgi:lactate dehydrogenase-like 2-hydroxyacid dehydrogenase
MNLVLLDTKTMGAIASLKIIAKYGDVTHYQTTSPEQTANRVREINIILTNKAAWDRTSIEQTTQQKLIGVEATGTNKSDKAATEERGISVKNAPDYSIRNVAQGT